LSASGRAERLLQDPAPTSAEIHELVAERLDAVEALFRDNLASPVRIVREIGSFLAEGGGKRVRPTLHLLASDLVGYRGPHAVLLAAVLEYIHSATLIHDDIIDEAATRRGRPSVNRRWGNNLTVLFGDYLFAKAMEMALQAGSLRIMERLAEVTLPPVAHARVLAISTVSRTERTLGGIGVGSTRAMLLQKLPAARCKVEFLFRHCALGLARAGHVFTDFQLTKANVVALVVVARIPASLAHPR